MFQEYFNYIQKDYLESTENTEHSYRTYLQNFLSAFEQQVTRRNLTIKHEPTMQEHKGRPDFKVVTKEQLTIGLIETKKLGADLSEFVNSEQLNRYKQLSDNIILTNYLDFILIKNGEPTLYSYLFPKAFISNLKYKIPSTRIQELTELLRTFFESEPEPICKTEVLAQKLSEKAIFLREYCYDELIKERDETNLMQGIYEAFKQSLLPLLDARHFADIYAQTLSYGLFLAGLNCNSAKQELNKTSAYSMLPSTFQLIKELFHRLDDFPPEIVWAIDEIISILKVTEFAEIRREFVEYRHREKGFSDPFIFFYEDFLKHYDKTQRKLRGVYYTPEPVVSYIVSSIEAIIKEKFKLIDGFANQKVTLLDFATGTGTFLLHSFEKALESTSRYGDKETVNKILNEQILGNFYGFELLVAPYVIAHLKISEYFRERGFSIGKGNRLNIYLTNTLTNEVPHPFPTMPSLSREGIQANRIKNKDILVILGNPPYAGHSANKNVWIDKEIRSYFEVDGEAINEKNPKWLNDDYVKFIRFAQLKMEKVERGVVGIISNHSYLDNPTFRGMRQSLMHSFDEIYILDLHGNAKKKEKSPDGSKDENVFEIQQGVAIAIFIKYRPYNKAQATPKAECKVFHSEIYGVKEAKYNTLFDLYIKNTGWTEIQPKSPFYLFKPRDERLLSRYNKFWSVRSIFNLKGVGITTAHDEFVINFNREKLIKKFQDFKNSRRDEDFLYEKFNVRKKLGWDILKGYDELQNENDLRRFIIPISYRPFDNRWIFYHNRLVWRIVKNIMINMQEENVGLVSIRQESSGPFNHVFVSNAIIESCYISNRTKEIGYVFPLYILSNGEEKIFFGVKEPELEYEGKTRFGLTKVDNFTPEFRNFIKRKFYKPLTPEQILGYIYAVLHSPTYRREYLEFLKLDFPRVPFADDVEMFEQLSSIGWELIQHHLLKKDYTYSICSMKGTGANYKVETVEYETIEPQANSEVNFIYLAKGEKVGRVWINKERYFEPIPEKIWNFYIGGYQVLDKWLKERKKHGISLTGEDIQHFSKVINVIDATLITTKRIDELTKKWI